jgi:hypothetical protein
MMYGMKYLALLVPFFCFCSVAEAHIPVFVAPQSSDEASVVTEPEVSHAYYGTLTGFPQTFEIQKDASFHLFVQLLQPDISTSKHDISAIVVRAVENTGRVKEVARLKAAQASWNSKFEPFGGDSYSEGPLFEQDVSSGTYKIEVHTPDNIGKYILVIGQKERFGEIGYLETIRRIAHIKSFFGKSQFLIIESPFVYVPILLLIVIFSVAWFSVRRQKQRQAM